MDETRTRPADLDLVQNLATPDELEGRISSQCWCKHCVHKSSGGGNKETVPFPFPATARLCLRRVPGGNQCWIGLHKVQSSNSRGVPAAQLTENFRVFSVIVFAERGEGARNSCKELCFSLDLLGGYVTQSIQEQWPTDENIQRDS